MSEAGFILVGLALGGLCGLLPLVLGLVKRRPVIASIAWVTCILTGPVVGLLSTAAVAIIWAVAILTPKQKPGPSAQMWFAYFAAAAACLVPVELLRAVHSMGFSSTLNPDRGLVVLGLLGMAALSAIVAAIWYEGFAQRKPKPETYPITVAACFSLTLVPALLGFLAAVLYDSQTPLLPSLLPGYLALAWLWSRMRRWQSVQEASLAAGTGLDAAQPCHPTVSP